jgi:hypothetical protein
MGTHKNYSPNLQEVAVYRRYLSPQALGSLGAQVGTGSKLVRTKVTLLTFPFEEAEEV